MDFFCAALSTAIKRHFYALFQHPGNVICLYVNGTHRGVVTCAENLDDVFHADLGEFDPQVGDKVRIEAEIDPESGYAQTKVSRETTVVAE